MALLAPVKKPGVLLPNPPPRERERGWAGQRPTVCIPWNAPFGLYLLTYISQRFPSMECAVDACKTVKSIRMRGLMQQQCMVHVSGVQCIACACAPSEISPVQGFSKAGEWRPITDVSSEESYE